MTSHSTYATKERVIVMTAYTVPGMKSGSAERVIALLQDRLNSLNDLALTLKHVHWNVIGPNFIAVHTMIDPQVDTVRAMADETAERIAALGGSPVGTPGALVKQRDWDDYSIGRADAIAHLGALDVVYSGIIEAHRGAIDTTEELDLVTQDMLIGQAGQLEQFHWFIRAHLEAADGTLSTAGAGAEGSAAKRAKRGKER
jgi:starvation-inducible DNA-binding protein